MLKNDREGAEDLDKDTLAIVAGPSNAKEVRVHGDHIHYRSVKGFSGIDQLRYQICDDGGRCSQASAFFDVS